MTGFNIITKNEVLVVDSRLIANELGIEHKAFIKTIRKYFVEFEEMGVLSFENSKPSEGSQGGRPETFCYLNEEQASYAMTLSRNTDTVRQCKRNLVTAFSKAKKAIVDISNQNQSLSQEMEKLKLELALAKEQNKLADSQTKLLATVQLLETISPGLAPLALGKADSIVERVEYVERVIDKSQDKVTEGVGITYLTKRFGFKDNRQTWQWLESIGYGKDSGKWENQLSAVTTPKLPKEAIADLARKFKEGNRQLFLGEKRHY